MRKGRFAGYQDDSPEAVRPLGPAALTAFDLRRPEPGDESILSERAASLAAAVPVMTASHLLWSAIILGATGPRPVLVGLFAGVLLLDMLLWLHERREAAPHLFVRAALAHAIITGGLWAAAAHFVAAGALASPVLAKVAVFAGVGAAVPAVFPIPLPLLASLAATTGSVALLEAQGPLALAAGLVSALLAWMGMSRARQLIFVARQRLAREKAGERAQRFLEDFERSGRGWFWETNADGILTHVSIHMARHVGTPASEMAGRRLEDLLVCSSDEGQRPLGFHLNARFPFADAIARASADADEHWWSLSGQPVFDDYGRFLGFRGMATNYSAEQRIEAERTRLARFDSLTGLPNRAMMAATLDQALANAAERRRGCALMLIDLDKFKQVNDTLGHPMGDKLLKQVAARLIAVLGEDGQPGRLGGDEFEAILPGIEEEGRLAQLAGRLIAHVSEPYQIEGNRIVIGASVGIAVARPGKALASALVQQADLALYAAKAAGRGTHRFFVPEMNSEAVERQILEADLRQALAKRQFQLLFQPIVDSVSEEAVAFEALLRWRHPTRGTLMPEAFLGLAEESGLMPRIGDWVIRTACEEAARWPAHLRVSVNMSPAQLQDVALVATLTATLASTGLDPDRLELEVGESVLEEGRPEARIAEKVKALGVRLVLDNYGAGRAGLGNLRNAPLDKIKIDRSFVRDAGDPDSRCAAVIRAVVVLAESLGMDTTAQGAETRDETMLIRRLGCSQIQGFFFGEPMPAEAARKLAVESKAAPEPVPGFSRPPRHRLIRNGQLEVGGRSLPVRLRTISEGGATLECEQPVEVESRVELDLDEAGRLAAEVRWCHSGRVGLRFDEPFRLGMLARRKARAPEMLRPGYLAVDAPSAEPEPPASPLATKRRRANR